ncbi:siderophore-interacting protein, partial [Leucobacter sp. M11]|uniref:siderophore-interacting protein n=1 Tax=Leucobacter sp. M11 TaxID=2993565 RepID=UPI002D7F362C
MTPNVPSADPSEAIVDSEGVLEQADHARDISGIELRVTRLNTPSRDLLRITCEAAIDLDDEAWSRSNVSVRIQVSGGPDESNDGTAGGVVSRVYTVRSYDPATRSMDIDVVLHPGESPMMRWVAALAVGDTFHLTGPRQHFLPPEPTDRPVALFLDETAIPALFSILAEWPAGRRAEAWIECPEHAPVAELPAVPGVTIHHLP